MELVYTINFLKSLPYMARAEPAEAELMEVTAAVNSSLLHKAIQDMDSVRAIEIINNSGEACRLVENSDGELPLHLASKDDKNKQIVEALLRDSSGEAKKQQLKAKNKYGNTPLHVATYQGNTAIVEAIIQECDDALLAELLEEKNSYDELPLHLASKDNKNEEIVKALLTQCRPETKKQQLTAKNKILGNTPLHVATFLGNTAIAEAIIQECDDTPLLTELLKKRNTMQDTPVHVAAGKNHTTRILEKMHEKISSCIENVGRFKGSPLHSACGYGKIDAVRKLVEWDLSKTHLELTSAPADLPAFTNTSEPKDLEMPSKEEKDAFMKSIESLSAKEQRRKKHDHYTPLTRACQFGHHEIVEFLLEEGAIRHHLALIKAVEGLHHECVKLLLFKRPFPEKALLSPYIPFDNSFVVTTIFRELIKHMPDIAELVINNECVKFERFLVNSKNFKIKLDYKFVDDDGHNWDLNKVFKENYTCCLQSAEEADHDVKTGDPEETKYDQNNPFRKETHPLSLMVKYKREGLLSHPVVAALIHDKWRSTYGILSIVHWVLYAAVYMVCTNSLLFTLPNPTSVLCTQADDGSGYSGLCSLNMNCNDTMNQTISDSRYAYIILTAALMLLYSVIRLGFEGIQLVTSIYYVICSLSLCTSKRSLYSMFIAIKQATYIWDLTNWIELILFLLSIVFSILVFVMNEKFCLSAWQWQMGVAIIWLSWIELIFLSTQFQFIGFHALMFIEILKTLFKFLPLALLLIFGFGLTFHFLLYSPNLMASPYMSPGYSFLKVLAMTAGDLNTDDFFGFDIRGQTQDTSHLQYLELSTLFWLLSLFFMTILLSNLMIGLAVGDIQTIINHAILKKLALQVNYLLAAESSSLFSLLQFSKKLHRRKRKEGKEFEPNKLSLNLEKEFFI